MFDHYCKVVNHVHDLHYYITWTLTTSGGTPNFLKRGCGSGKGGGVGS